MLPQMQMSKKAFKKVKGLQFFKLMGSGSKGGFSIVPDFTTFALVCVWNGESFANDFFTTSVLFNEFKTRALYNWTVYLKAVKAHGAWSGRVPFTEFTENKTGLVAVITRATIKWHMIPRFWLYVPQVSRGIKKRKGLMFSIGIGEYPLFMQATFSIWDSRKNMAEFAYKNGKHKEVVQKTRQLGWYKEELFANFMPFKTIGSWNGKNPLKDVMPTEKP